MRYYMQRVFNKQTDQLHASWRSTVTHKTCMSDPSELKKTIPGVEQTELAANVTVAQYWLASGLPLVIMICIV